MFTLSAMGGLAFAAASAIKSICIRSISIFTALLVIPLSAQAVNVTINSGNYLGEWDMDFDGISRTGTVTLDLAVGSHTLRPGLIGRFVFSVDAAGQVTVGSGYDGVSATGGLGVLNILTIPVSVDPAAFLGNWEIRRVRGPAPGTETVELVPGNKLLFGRLGVCYSVSAGVQTASVLVCLRGDGSMEVNNGAFATADMMYDDGGTLRFRNTTIVVDDTSGSSVPWNIRQVTTPYLYGDATIVLVPGAQYGFEGSFGFRSFSVAEPCAIAPPTQDVGTTIFEFSCGLIDTDEDGVPDTSDNCPINANPDQIDLDQDGAGDSCDADDDNDGVDDNVDNCPADPNSDQVDTDGDGQGDMCDGDDDGDGIANEIDLCPFSPLLRPVDTDGCTGTQLIARVCQRSGYIQHGKYVSCVAHAANIAADEGLIAPNEKSKYVKEAAKNK